MGRHLVPLAGVTLLTLVWLSSSPDTLRHIPCDSQLWTIPSQEFEDFDNNSGVQTEQFIVPNYVHFLRMGPNLKEINFMELLCILAVLKHQKPDRLFFHTDHKNFTGKYWDKLLSMKGFSDTIEFVPTELPMEIFGQKLSSSYHLFHAGDILRIQLLMKYGGIFLDNDSYLVRSLDKYRKYEIALSWDDDSFLGTQVLVTHKDSRFLALWLDTYRNYYPDLWYYNAGERPTKMVLFARPELVHRVKLLFGTQWLVDEIYYSVWPQWRDQFAIHVLTRHYNRPKQLFNGEGYLPDKFTEDNVLLYNNTLRQLALEVYPF